MARRLKISMPTHSIATNASAKKSQLSSFRGERGSLLPLTFGFFIIALILIFVLVNFSSVMMRQRILIQENEFALMEASHQLNKTRYYLFGLDQNLVNSEFRVPIDCADARSAYLREIALVNIDKYAMRSVTDKEVGVIEVVSFACDGNKVNGEVAATYVLPLQAETLGLSAFTVRANGSATNQYNR